MAVDYAIIGHRLQMRRKEIGLTQEKLAEKAGITVVYLSKVENGWVHPTLELLDTLSAVLEIDLAILLTGVQTDTPNYGDERVTRLFSLYSPKMKQAALAILEQLAKLS